MRIESTVKTYQHGIPYKGYMVHLLVTTKERPVGTTSLCTDAQTTAKYRRIIYIFIEIKNISISMFI